MAPSEARAEGFSGFLSLLQDVTCTNVTFAPVHFQGLKKVEELSEFETSIKNTNAKKLRLVRFRIGEPGVIALSMALEFNRSLRSLQLKEVSLSDNEAIALGRVLCRNCTLQELDLTKNNIGDLGAAVLAENLKENTGLYSLKVNANKIGDYGARALAEALRCNWTLESLSLSENQLTKLCIESFLLAVRFNATVSKINISKNRIPPELLYQVELALQSSKQERLKEAKQAFARGLRKGGRVSWQRNKLILLGEGNVGKTSLLESFVQFKADETPWHQQSRISKRYIRVGGDGLWENYTAVRACQRFLGEIGYLLCLKEMQPTTKISNDTSEQASKEKRIERKPKRRAVGFPRFIETFEKLQFHESKLKAAFVNRKDLYVTVWDYGSNSDTYFLNNRLFLTQSGVYILVFSMLDFIENTQKGKEQLISWLQIVKLHSPNSPVLLVGLHLDEIMADKKTISGSSFHGPRDYVAYIHSKLLDLPSSFPQLCTHSLTFWPASNSTTSTIDGLKGAIEEALRNEDLSKTEIPRSWLKCLELVLSENDAPTIELSEFFNKVKPFTNLTQSQIEPMLISFHELGAVMYFHTTETLRQMIVTDTTWLVGKLEAISTGMLGYIKWAGTPRISELEEKGLADDCRMFLLSGLATLDILEHFWGTENSHYFMCLMQELLMLSRWDYAGREAYLLIPTMIPATNTSLYLESISCFFKFEYIPIGLFERLVCECVNSVAYYGEAKKPRLTRESCMFWFKPEVAVALSKKDNKRIECYTQDERLANEILTKLEAMLRKIKTGACTLNITWETYVIAEEKNMPLSEAKREHIYPWAAVDSSLEGKTNNLDLDKFAVEFS